MSAAEVRSENTTLHEAILAFPEIADKNKVIGVAMIARTRGVPIQNILEVFRAHLGTYASITPEQEHPKISFAERDIWLAAAVMGDLMSCVMKKAEGHVPAPIGKSSMFQQRSHPPEVAPFYDAIAGFPNIATKNNIKNTALHAKSRSVPVSTITTILTKHLAKYMSITAEHEDPNIPFAEKDSWLGAVVLSELMSLLE